MIFVVPKSDQGQRLDKFLVSQIPGRSRSQIQKMIKAGSVLINDQTVTVHHFLKEGDKIQIKKEVNEEKLNMELLNIIFENDDFLILNKPSGILVHPTK